MKKIVLLVLILMVGFLESAIAQHLAQSEPFVYNDAGKRDPFWPLVSASGAIITYDAQELSASDMMLTGVMTGSDGQNVAVINGKIVKEGDMIGAFRVDRIISTLVVLDKGDEKSELHLKKEE